MSVLIEGMKMPKNCCECWFMEGADEWCCAHRGRYLEPDYRIAIKDKPDWCPLVEVPPHGRLGDLDKLEKMFSDIDSAPYSCFDGEEPFYSAEDATHIIKLAPTVIPAEEGE